MSSDERIGLASLGLGLAKRTRASVHIAIQDQTKAANYVQDRDQTARLVVFCLIENVFDKLPQLDNRAHNCQSRRIHQMRQRVTSRFTWSPGL